MTAFGLLLHSPSIAFAISVAVVIVLAANAIAKNKEESKIVNDYYQNNFQWRIQHEENKNPQIFIILLQEKNASTEQHQNDRSDLQGSTENMFYSEKNSSKLCAEGAVGNLMNVLHCPEDEVKQFWDIVQSPMYLIQQTLSESSVPKAVLKSGGECDSIQKSLWILCKKFKFRTCSRPDGQPQVDKQGLRSLPS
jgi:hypothetical protein